MMTIYEALADPTRRRMLDLIRERPRSVNELVDLLAISQPLASKHLRVLRQAGVVSVRQDAQRRWYELRPEPLAEMDAWLAPYRQLWESRFDRLDALLKEMQDTDDKENEDEQA
jgi:DNA-binding transcriptional ArsR family regulator